MIKRKLLPIGIYVVIFLSFAWFCAVKMPVLQEMQRKKVLAEEHKILKELEKEHQPVYYAEFSSPEVYSGVSQTMYTYLGTKRNIKGVEEPTEVVVPIATEAPTVTETPITQPTPSYSEKDLYLLSHLIYAEAGCESYQCQLYVGSVVLNRCASSQFPNTISEVIFQNSGGIAQFSVTIPVRGFRPIDKEPDAEAIQAAKELLTTGTKLPADVLVFYAKYSTGKWVTSRCKYMELDHTVFAYVYSN